MCKYPFATAYVPAARPVRLGRGDIAEGRFAQNRDPIPYGLHSRSTVTVYTHGLHPKMSFFGELTEFHALERFSEAGSAPIRSALKFYFGIDVRIFSQLFLKNIFFERANNFLKNRQFSTKVEKI